MENLTRMDTKASGRMRWAHANRPRLRMIRTRPWHDAVSRGEKLILRGTDPEVYITEYTSVYEDNFCVC